MGSSDRNESPESPESSGAATPNNPNRASASYITNMWTGLIRRFSSEGSFPSQADTAYEDDYNEPLRPPPLDPLVLHGYRHGTPTSAKLLTPAVAEEIRTMVPERLRIVDDWHLIYSLEQDGASLTTLYQRCRHYEGKRAGFVLVVKDLEGGIFGAYLSEYPHPAHSYFGNGECFLWRASTITPLLHLHQLIRQT
ncbi:oxidation resistance protein 1 [Fusarium musae]|uniref:Oxidation resistance protein 1 n=1 Tax=Fusarium musae TaxID=1042133 RepID=A0A9P8INJ1_9HYPO|nr:oxidation resistance protein 1 [Fusarium musae]KAG9501411.1 oxidation resistance protein 1 [Fusarium musae]